MPQQAHTAKNGGKTHPSRRHFNIKITTGGHHTARRRQNPETAPPPPHHNHSVGA
ncbi:MAG: hypothetical protein AAFV33_21560 [Chloroflexota bacterium]